MVHSPNPENPDVAVIKDFERRLDKRWLRKEGDVWYADVTGHAYPDELTVSEEYMEGARKVITVNAFERNAAASLAYITDHGAICKARGFYFENNLW